MTELQNFEERIFDLLSGEIDLERYPGPESRFVKSAFEEGSLCSRAYEDALMAYSNLCNRLNEPDLNDPDVERIFNNLRAISKHLCIEMYRYGVFFGQHGDREDQKKEKESL